MSHSDWRAVLEGTRGFNRRPPCGYDLRPYWREEAFRRHPGSLEPVAWADAFANVLDHARIHVYPGDLILGSRQGFWAEAFPDGAGESDYRGALDAQNARGRRGFTAGWDHTVADYPTLLEQGVGGLLSRISESGRTHSEPKERAALEGFRSALEGFGRFIRRHADAAADAESAARLDWISSNPPRTFHEAAQLVWLTHIAFVGEGRYANALGRLDQYLFPFYERDLAAGRLDRAAALDLLCHLWAHIEELGEVTNICVGGLTPDGRDGTNDLSLLCVEATRLVQSPHTNLSARFHDDSPDSFHRAAFECVRTGVGFPAIFNDHVLVPGLVEIGIPVEVARDHCMVGCIETMFAGRQQAWSDSRFNTPIYPLFPQVCNYVLTSFVDY